MMSLTSNEKKIFCCESSKNDLPWRCDSIEQSLSGTNPTSERQEEFPQKVQDIKEEYNTLKRNLRQSNIRKPLLTKIAQWQKETIAKICSTAKKARDDLKQLEQTEKRLTHLLDKLSNELPSNRKPEKCTEADIEKWKKQLKKYRREFEKMSATKITEITSPMFQLITIGNTNMSEKETVDVVPQDEVYSEEKNKKTDEDAMLLQVGDAVKHKSDLARTMMTVSASEKYRYPSATFGVTKKSRTDLCHLFEKLRLLNPMDKTGPMSGNCDAETHQMEDFLSQTFEFKNRHGKYIVQGVKSFKLGKPPHSMYPNIMIHFPSNHSNSFAMTVKEVIQWQHSYAVYADKNAEGMSKEFLRRALKGLSEAGEEAFLMKFVVRISTCPILMEFDAQVISRQPQDEWPHKIKLVSVTGVDFAGRKHDVSDITTYVSNWNDVYEIDPKSGLPQVYNGRDFHTKVNRPRGKLHKERLLKDLLCMARLRLRACDAEGVEIVVETGIGLGVFAGKHIGIDSKVRGLSALAIRTVLEEDGPSYQTIRGIVFALPIFDDGRRTGRIEDTYQAFVGEFEGKKYNGPVPVLITDQDMHRLTVAIALQGFTVSELNPADSHGVFGEYWQNRGPAVEEKLALTTVGLLVQHHLINPEVLDPNNYHLI